MIPLSFVAFMYCTYLGIRTMIQHKEHIQHVPVKSSQLLRADTLLLEREKILEGKDISQVTINMLVDVATINEQLDSLCRTERYSIDNATFSRLSRRYIWLDQKLSNRYRLLMLAGALSLALSIWLGSIFYFREGPEPRNHTSPFRRS